MTSSMPLPVSNKAEAAYDEVAKLREANFLAQEVLRQRCVKNPEYETSKRSSSSERNPDYFDIWGAGEYLQQSKTLSYVEKYLQRTEKLLSHDKQLIPVTNLTSYEVVDDVDSLFNNQKISDEPTCSSSNQNEVLLFPAEDVESTSVHGSDPSNKKQDIDSDTKENASCFHHQILNESENKIKEKCTQLCTHKKRETEENKVLRDFESGTTHFFSTEQEIKCNEANNREVDRRPDDTQISVDHEQKGKAKNGSFMATLEPEKTQARSAVKYVEKISSSKEDIESSGQQAICHGESGEILESAFFKLLLTDQNSKKLSLNSRLEQSEMSQEKEDVYPDIIKESCAVLETMEGGLSNKIIGTLEEERIVNHYICKQTREKPIDFKVEKMKKVPSITLPSNEAKFSECSVTEENSYSSHYKFEKPYAKTISISSFPKYVARPTTSFDSLPEEMILKIFSFLAPKDLKRVSMVCEKFNHLSKDPYLWHTLEVIGKELTREWFESLLSAKLRRVHLQKCTSRGLNQKCLRAFFRSCYNTLRHLHVSECTGEELLGDNVLLHVSSRCNNIHHVSIPWSNTTNNGMSALNSSAIELEYLDISGNCFISDESFIPFVRNKGRKLRSLKANGCFALSSEGFLSVAQNCPKLKVLHMGLCSKVTSDCIICLFPNLKYLKDLDLRRLAAVSDESLHVISENCKQLTKIVLDGCTAISDTGICDFTSSLQHLTHINIAGCTNITDRGVCSLVVSTENLVHLNMSSTGATHVSVQMITENCFDSLETLKVSFCKNITHECIQKLISFCFKLKCLHIYSCKRVKTQELRESNCSTLEICA